MRKPEDLAYSDELTNAFELTHADDATEGVNKLTAFLKGVQDEAYAAGKAQRLITAQLALDKAAELEDELRAEIKALKEDRVVVV